jgi:hypothetical protein
MRPRASGQQTRSNGFPGGVREQALVQNLCYSSTDPEKAVAYVAVKPLVDKVMKGYNGGVFVYGQTGSGKTYTMQGDLSPTGFQNRGLVPRILEEIFLVRTACQTTRIASALSRQQIFHLHTALSPLGFSCCRQPQPHILLFG